METDEEDVEYLLGMRGPGICICMTCVMVPCMCDLRELEEKIAMLRQKHQLETGQVVHKNYIDKDRKEDQEDQDAGERQEGQVEAEEENGKNQETGKDKNLLEIRTQIII